MASNNISPLTGVQLAWGNADSSWHPSVKRLYKSFQTNPYKDFFYQTDIEMMRILCLEHSKYLYSADGLNANLVKAIFSQWGAFGATVKDRAEINFVIKSAEKEDDFSNYDKIIKLALNGPE